MLRCRRCGARARRLGNAPTTKPLDIASLGGRVGDWRAICAAAAELEGADQARAFFERHFTPYEARNGAEAVGLFTGYFEPELRGATQAGGRYAVPLYARPPDLVTVDLGLFRSALAGDRLAGRVADGALEPYATRAEIDGGALAAQGLELVWVDDPIDAFFLHIQGSGRITFEDGTSRRLAYAATNGHSYFAIGRRLVDLGALDREDVSMQTIRDWLAANPKRASEIIARERVLRVLPLARGGAGDGRSGRHPGRGTYRRSLARGGPPLRTDERAGSGWRARRPGPDPAREDRPLRRLMVAQDTGGAIRGPGARRRLLGHGCRGRRGCRAHEARGPLLAAPAPRSRRERAPGLTSRSVFPKL